MKVNLSKIIYLNLLAMIACECTTQQVTATAVLPKADRSAVLLPKPAKFSFQTSLRLSAAVHSPAIQEKLKAGAKIEFFLNNQMVGALTKDSLTAENLEKGRLPINAAILVKNSEGIKLSYKVTDSAGQISSEQTITTVCRAEIYNPHGYKRVDGKDSTSYIFPGSVPLILGPMGWDNYYVEAIRLDIYDDKGQFVIRGGIKDRNLPPEVLEAKRKRALFEKDKKVEMWDLDGGVKFGTSDADLNDIAYKCTKLLQEMEGFSEPQFQAKMQSKLQKLQDRRLQKMTLALTDSDSSGTTYEALYAQLQLIPADNLVKIVNKMLLLKQKMGDKSYMVLLRDTLLSMPVETWEPFLNKQIG